jgi:SAM-dependent methyltransferase
VTGAVLPPAGVPAGDSKLDRGGAKDASKSRWRGAQPDHELTWGVPLTGDAFVAKMQEHFRLGPTSSVVEIGPGYGRLLRSLLGSGLPFGQYVGVDLSAPNCAWLDGKYGRANVSFLNGEASSVSLPRPYDLLVSSLTLKHVYPTFEAAVRNLARQGAPNATMVFDLMEADLSSFLVDAALLWAGRSVPADGAPRHGSSPRRALVVGSALLSADFFVRGRYGTFESDGVTYLCKYTKRGVREILRRCGLRSVTYDYVWHDRTHRRLLVVARRS